ncbi:MAG TPA: hypothetical protein VNI84_03885 [Pyrinomonadaceae bacterium]|nr:hypothetical protein [Pyrinomonadaceae bacterium]
MIKVLEKSKKHSEQGFDSLVVEIPKDFAVSHGLPEKSFVTLTLRNGKMTSEIISYSDTDEKEVEEFLADFPGFDEEMKKIGD